MAKDEAFIYVFQYINNGQTITKNIGQMNININKYQYNNSYINLLYKHTQNYPITIEDLLSCILD